jgi:elongation factor G
MNPASGINVIEAQAPYAELLRYALNLRSLTQGRGSFVMEFDHYEEVPAHLSQKIIAEKKKAA